MFLVHIIISKAVWNVPVARFLLIATIIFLRDMTRGGRVVLGKGNARAKDINTFKALDM